MSYYDDLKSPKWQKKRLEILSKHNFTCENCGDKERQLHVHHSWYESKKKAWEYDNDCYKVLCEFCHELEHTVKLQIEKELSIYSIEDMESIYYFLSNTPEVTIEVIKSINMARDYAFEAGQVSMYNRMS